MVSQVFYYNQAQQYPQIQQDYKDVKTHVDKTDSTDEIIKNSALDVIPMLRRTSSLKDKMDNSDTIGVAGSVGLTVVNLPEDLRDMNSAWGKFKAFLKGEKYQGAYDYKNYQHDFSFLRGTLLEPFIDLKNTKNKALAKKLYASDKTILSTGFGKKIRDLLGVEMSDQVEVRKFNKETSVWEVARDINGKARRATAFEGKGKFKAFGELTARAMNRTTLIGTGVLAALELPKILKAMNQGDNIVDQTGNTFKQTAKSGINLASITAGIAYGGAIGSKHGGPLGSLVGMGVGAAFGSFTSKKLQEAI